VAARFRWAARIASALVTTLGAMVLFGWLFGIVPLERIHPALVSMKLNTALSLVLLGVALWLSLVHPVPARLMRGLAVAAIAIAGATLIEDAFRVDLGIDELIRRDWGQIGAPGRMSPATAAVVILFGLALTWVDTQWAEVLALLGGLIADITLLGYLYGASDLYAIGPFAAVAAHTAIALFVLALGIMFARPDRGLMQVVASDTTGGVVARRLLPAAVLLPPVIALVRQWGEQAGLYGTGFGRALLVASSSTLFVALIGWTAAMMSRADRRRRAAELEVREREAHLAITLDSIGDAVIATDATGRVTRMNSVAEQLTGWTAAAALGKPLPEVFRIVDEDTGGPVESPVDRVLRDGVTVGLANNTALVSRDGTRRAIANSGAPIRDADGETRGVVMVFHDQTEARAAARRLRDNEARKAAILESALDAVVSMDASGAIIEFNPAAEAMFGRRRDAVIGSSLAETVIPAALRDGHTSGLARYLTSRNSRVIGQRVELTAMRSDGSEFPVEISIARIGHDEPPTFTGFIRDVSAAHQARAELLRSNDRLRLLAQVSSEFAAVTTSYQALLGRVARTIADLIGDGCMVTLLSDDGEQLNNVANAHRDPALEADYRTYLAGFTVAMATSSSVSAEVVRTGQPRRADLAPDTLVAQSEDALRPLVARLNVHSFAVVPIRARQVIGTLSLLRCQPGHGYTDDDLTLLQDIAARAGLAIESARLYEQLEDRVRERTQELETANQELEAFSYSVAHDLRSPLRGIAGFSHTMVEDYAGRLEPEGVMYLNRIEAGAQRLGTLIDDLLDLSRVSRTELFRRQLDLSEMARAVIARLQAKQPRPDVEIAIEDSPSVLADPRLVDIVLTNILGNAWKFTSKRAHARIELAACPGPGPTTYFIRDNGAGFDPTYAGKLFGVFERLHPASQFEGTGIGLAIARRIVERHGGRIWAESAVEQGATLFFTLEARPRRETVQAPQSR
jgi:PAS domain S-box-containing protein